MVWWLRKLRKHRQDKRKVQIGPICIRFLYKTVSSGIFLLSGRCFLVNSLGHKNKRPAPIFNLRAEKRVREIQQKSQYASNMVSWRVRVRARNCLVAHVARPGAQECPRPILGRRSGVNQQEPMPQLLMRVRDFRKC